MEVAQGRTGLFRVFSLRHDFPDALRQFLSKPATEAGAQELDLVLGADRFPFQFRTRGIKVADAAVFVQLKGDATYDPLDPLEFTLQPPSGGPKPLQMDLIESEMGGLPAAHAGLGTGAAISETSGLPAANAALGTGVAISETKAWKLSATTLPAALRTETDVDGTTVERLDATKLDDIGILLRYSF
jgi:hypothetical protein